MKEIVILLGIIALWWLVMGYILPKMGVPT